MSQSKSKLKARRWEGVIKGGMAFCIGELREFHAQGEPQRRSGGAIHQPGRRQNSELRFSF
jgi:hypothetical protein